MSAIEWALLTDPVCGRSVEVSSPYRVIHGGALFAFCGADCRLQFVDLPSRYAIISPAVPELAPWTPAAPVGDMQALAGAQGPFSWLLAWRERRHATSCARELLKLYRMVAARSPELKGTDLYRQIVAERLGTLAVADAVLHHAEQSFAIWPVRRALNFRDVVHYIAVSEFVAANESTRWVYADIRHIVQSVIPQQL